MNRNSRRKTGIRRFNKFIIIIAVVIIFAILIGLAQKVIESQMNVKYIENNFKEKDKESLKQVEEDIQEKSENNEMNDDQEGIKKYRYSMQMAENIFSAKLNIQILYIRGEITEEQFSDFTASYIYTYNQAMHFNYYTTDLNECIRDCLGEKTIYIADDVEEKINVISFSKGIEYYEKNRIIMNMWLKKQISNEIYIEYRDKTTEVLKNLTDKGMYELLEYMDGLIYLHEKKKTIEGLIDL